MSLDIAPGELVVLLGPSGCGKTTALRVLAGLEDIDSGSVLVGGQQHLRDAHQQTGHGHGLPGLFAVPAPDRGDNVAFGLRLRGRGTAERNKISAEYLELVGLAEKSGQYPHQLSGGQQQRVALARALAISPQVLLLDEPLSALDAKVRVQLRDEIRRIQMNLGITTLFVTHDQEEALAVADRVGVMRAGQLEQIDAPEILYTRPRTAFVAEFVGLTNRLPGIASGESATVLGSVVPLLPGSVSAGPVTVLIRPESLRLTALERPTAGPEFGRGGNDQLPGRARPGARPVGRRDRCCSPRSRRRRQPNWPSATTLLRPSHRCRHWPSRPEVPGSAAADQRCVYGPVLTGW